MDILRYSFIFPPFALAFKLDLSESLQEKYASQKLVSP